MPPPNISGSTPPPRAGLREHKVHQAVTPTIKHYDPNWKLCSTQLCSNCSNIGIYWKQYPKLQRWTITTNLWIHAVYPSCPVSARSFLSSFNSFSLSVSHSRTLWRTCVSSPVTCKVCINCTQHCVIRTQISSVITMKNK